MVHIAPLFLELWSQRGISFRRPRVFISVSLAPPGTLAYLAYPQVRFGDFRALLDTETHRSRHAFQPTFLDGIDVLRDDGASPIQYPAGSVPSRGFFLGIDTTMLILFAVAGILLWIRVRRSYGALVISYLLVPAFSGSTQSLIRYVAVLFPVFILLACVKSEPLRSAIAGVFLCGLVVASYLFLNDSWAG